jgi:thymidylate synthase (FAD)
MKIIDQSWSFEHSIDGLAILKQIEKAGRTCYKSEAKITEDSAIAFCRRIIESEHHSVLEHVSVSVRIITNRGVSHEIVRHRLASYSQESTRYCDYEGEVEFIRPVWSKLPLGTYNPNTLDGDIRDTTDNFLLALDNAKNSYKKLRAGGWSPQQAREVLPNALKTELVMTANIREWRHFFTLRCSKAAHPQMRALALNMLLGFKKVIPVLFNGIIGE